MKQILITVIAVLISQVSLAQTHAKSLDPNSVWERYGKTGRALHKDYLEIDFEHLYEGNLSIPDGLKEERNHYSVYIPFDTEKLKRVEDKIVGILKQKGISDVLNMTTKQVIETSAAIVADSMKFQFVSGNDRIEGFGVETITRPDGTTEVRKNDPDFLDSFMAGAGEPVHYSNAFVYVFNWFKAKKIPSIKNIFVLSILDYDFTDSPQNAAEAQFMIDHGVDERQTNNYFWNIIVILEKEYLTYSFVDLMPPFEDITLRYQKMGQLHEAIEGKQLSQFRNRNLARLFEGLEENVPAFDYYEKAYREVLDFRNIEASDISTLNLAYKAEDLEQWDDGYRLYSLLYRGEKLNKDKKLDERYQRMEESMASFAFKIKNYSESLVHYKNLFEHGEKDFVSWQLRYLHGIFQNLYAINQLFDFKLFLETAKYRKLPVNNDTYLRADLVIYEDFLKKRK